MEQIRILTKIFQNLKKSLRAGMRNTLFFYLAFVQLDLPYFDPCMVILMIAAKYLDILFPCFYRCWKPVFDASHSYTCDGHAWHV